MRTAPDVTRWLYQTDDTRGFIHVPRTDVVLKAKVPYRVTINSRGYRDREWDFSSPFRVLVAGDSFTYGQGLPVEEGFVRKAEHMLAGRAAFELFSRTPNAMVLSQGERRAVDRAGNFMTEARHHRLKTASGCMGTSKKSWRRVKASNPCSRRFGN